MITCNESGSIVVKIDDAEYDLSISEQYANFLLWATSTDAKEVIDADAFKVDDCILEENREKAFRYAEFLKEYALRRQNKLAEMAKILTTEQREEDINAFIERLRSPDAPLYGTD